MIPVSWSRLGHDGGTDGSSLPAGRRARRYRPVMAGGVAATTVVVSLLTGISGASAAGASAGPGTPGSQTFSYAPREQTFTVPPGVSILVLTVDGGGGGGGLTSSGGAGGEVTGDLAVTPGQQLSFFIGPAGRTDSAPQSSSCSGAIIAGGGYPSTGGTGGFGEGLTETGGNGGNGDLCVAGGGGGGGGATTVYLGAYSSGSLVAVAGGGGGGGGGIETQKLGGVSIVEAAGGNGGSGSAGDPGGPGNTSVQGGGGAGGLVGGSSTGAAAAGGTASGGGGGGGGGYPLAGGGGGAGSTSSGTVHSGGGGGGAGGQSLTSVLLFGAATPSTRGADIAGQLTIAYTALPTTTTTVAVTPAVSVQGAAVTYSASVVQTTAGAATPQGAVTFSAGGMYLCSGDLDAGGHASCASSQAPTGKDTVTADFNSLGNLFDSSATTTETVLSAPISTTTSLAAHPVVIRSDQTDTFRSAVTSPSASSPATGTVTVSLAGSPVCTSTVATKGGITDTTCQSATLPVGTDTLTATYSGDATHASSSGTTVVNVGPAKPAVTSISPASGPAAGGTTVTINGAGFTGASLVRFDGKAATSFTVVTDTQITAVSPAQTAGIRQIRIATPGGVTPEVNADRYTVTP